MNDTHEQIGPGPQASGLYMWASREAFDKLYAETSRKEKLLQGVQKQIESLENDMKLVGLPNFRDD